VPGGQQLIIPCETQAREFDAKLLLACFAAERGHRVITGSKKEINIRIASMPRSIYLSKSLTIRNLFLYELLERLGHRVIGGDEEGLVWPSPRYYLHSKVAAATFEKCRALVAWGERNAEIWRQFAPDFAGRIYVAGNARIDLLRPELRGLFEADRVAISERHAPYVLINTNFSRLNHYLPGQSRHAKKIEQAAGQSSTAAPSGEDMDLALAEHKRVLFEHFREMLPTIAGQCPNHTVVLRPHPSEKKETWEEITRDCANVRVVYQGNVVPWILGCELLVHNGCTTGLEAYLLGKPALAYQPVRSDYDLDLPNELSFRAFDLTTLLDKTRQALAGTLKDDDAEHARKEALIDANISGRRGAFACEGIVDALESFAADTDAEPLPALGRRAAAWTVAQGRRAVQRVQGHIPGSHNNKVYLRHMFPGASLAEVQTRVRTFGELLGRFGAVRVRQRHENVFEIDAA
jgi:surface carbohydrate biosynthesis protein